MTHFTDSAWLGKFLGLAESAAALRGRLSDEDFVARLIEIGREYCRSDEHPTTPQMFPALCVEPGPVLVEGMPARSVYDHKLGKFMLNTVNYVPGVGYK